MSEIGVRMDFSAPAGSYSDADRDETMRLLKPAFQHLLEELARHGFRGAAAAGEIGRRLMRLPIGQIGEQSSGRCASCGRALRMLRAEVPEGSIAYGACRNPYCEMENQAVWPMVRGRRAEEPRLPYARSNHG